MRAVGQVSHCSQVLLLPLGTRHHNTGAQWHRRLLTIEKLAGNKNGHKTENGAFRKRLQSLGSGWGEPDPRSKGAFLHSAQ